jgi:hypothetical protein
MRLINVRGDTPVLHEFLQDEVPAYAILSHTWGRNEVTLQDLQSGDSATYTSKEGFQKIKFSCKQALDDKIEWIWVDTVCIDKTSSAELSEAINSMFRWYQKSRVCYAYLVDVKSSPSSAESFSWEEPSFSTSRWWSRGTNGTH